MWKGRALRPSPWIGERCTSPSWPCARIPSVIAGWPSNSTSEIPTRLSPRGPNAWVMITRTSSSTVTCGPVTARWRPVIVRLRRSTGSMRGQLAMPLRTWQAVCEPPGPGTGTAAGATGICVYNQRSGPPGTWADRGESMTRPLAVVFAVSLISGITGISGISGLGSGVAHARPKVALTQIEGDTTGDVHDAVAEALEGSELSLIGSKEVNRAVDKLGDLADLTEKDFKKLANELEADAIVLGKLDKAGGAKTLRFRLYVHKKMTKGFTVSFKDPKSEKFRSLLHDKMVDKLSGASDDDEERPLSLIHISE